MVQLTGALIAAEEVSLALLPAEAPDTAIAVHRTWTSCGSCALRYTWGLHASVPTKAYIKESELKSGAWVHVQVRIRPTNKNTASGHGTTVLTSDWLGGD